MRSSRSDNACALSGPGYKLRHAAPAIANAGRLAARIPLRYPGEPPARVARAKREGISTMAQARHPTGINRQGAPGRPLELSAKSGRNPESERGWRGRKSDSCRAGMRPAGDPKAVLRAVVLNGSEGSKTGPSTL